MGISGPRKNVHSFSRSPSGGDKFYGQSSSPILGASNFFGKQILNRNKGKSKANIFRGEPYTARQGQEKHVLTSHVERN
jgi:hypothetical protein